MRQYLAHLEQYPARKAHQQSSFATLSTLLRQSQPFILPLVSSALIASITLTPLMAHAAIGKISPWQGIRVAKVMGLKTHDLGNPAKTSAKKPQTTMQPTKPTMGQVKKAIAYGHNMSIQSANPEKKAAWVIGNTEVLALTSSAGGLNPQARIKLAHERLSTFMDQGGNPRDIQPSMINGQAVVMAGKQLIIGVDDAAIPPAALKAGLDKKDAAKQQALSWANKLRQALGTTAISRQPTLIASRSGFSPSLDLARQQLNSTGNALVGMASWYGPGFHNRRSSNGERFDMNAMTAAHRTLKFNTIVKVTNLWTGKNVLVRITDRGPHRANRIIDLSKGAADAIGMISSGTAPVKMEVMQ